MIKNVWLVFWRFLSLGLISFGGPAAHVGYFQKTFVEKLKWLDEASYARIIALSQFLPGPGSSQVCFAVGLRHGGIAGGCAAFLGFTLPSFFIMYALAIIPADQNPDGVFNGVIHGLKLLAVVVVASATRGMALKFCQEKFALGLAICTAAVLLIVPSIWTQIVVLLAAASIGLVFHAGAEKKPAEALSVAGGRLRKLPLLLFTILLFGLPFLVGLSTHLDLFADFYQTGSLVFGGGHVVLPLLQQTLADSVSTDRFLLGYAGAQAIPGPMFSLAAYLGAELHSGSALLGALIATLGIFLPGFLLVISLQGAWESLAAKARVAGAVWGINASVVGLLLAALYQPVFISAVSTPLEMALVALGFYALQSLKTPVVVLVGVFAALGVLLQYV